MDRGITTLAIGILVVAGGIVGAAYAVGAFDDPPEPELIDFETDGPTCATGDATGEDVELTPVEGATRVTVEGAMGVPDLAHGVGNASVERVGESNYTLSVETLEPENGTMGAMCIGRVNYTATVRIPQDANATFTLAVIEDGERSAILRNGQDGAGVEADASANR